MVAHPPREHGLDSLIQGHLVSLQGLTLTCAQGRALVRVPEMGERIPQGRWEVSSHVPACLDDSLASLDLGPHAFIHPSVFLPQPHPSLSASAPRTQQSLTFIGFPVSQSVCTRLCQSGLLPPTRSQCHGLQAHTVKVTANSRALAVQAPGSVPCSPPTELFLSALCVLGLCLSVLKSTLQSLGWGLYQKGSGPFKKHIFYEHTLILYKGSLIITFPYMYEDIFLHVHV